MKTRKDLKPFISKNFMSVLDHETVANTIARLRSQKDDFHDRFVYLYVTNREQKLVGVLRTRDLLVEDSESQIGKVMQRSVVCISEDASLDELVKLFNAYTFFAIPVIDKEDRLVGIIPERQIHQYLDPEMRHVNVSTGQFSVEEIESKSIFEIVFKRLPWLLISVTSGLVCAYILGIFIGRIESIVALVLFVPIILGLAGSAGTQSARITARSLTEGKLVGKKVVKMMLKIGAMGLTIGTCAFLIAGIIALVWKKPPVEGVALCISIVLVMIVSGMLGIIVPSFLKFLRLSANIGSGLFLLLICDMVALVLYFSIALSLVNPTLELK